MVDSANRNDRQADARREYERIMTTPSPEPTGAYIDAGVIGFVFGEMWRRGVLTARDRRWITLTCVGADDSVFPIESHVWAALNSGEVTIEEFDEFVLHFATQLGWPKASVLNMYGTKSSMKLAEAGGKEPPPVAFEPWSDPAPDEARRARGEAAYREIHGQPAPAAVTAFRGGAYLDYMYGEVWTRERYLTRRDRRIISICCSGVARIDEETQAHLRGALVNGELTYRELQELVVHYAVYVGWLLGRHLDDLLIQVAADVGATGA
jgi:4-carboxymuconolactone decarboxylase